MSNPQFVEEKPLALADVKSILHDIEKRDKELSYLSNKAKEYLDAFVKLDLKKKAELHQKLTDLNLVRLKEEYIVKIIDFLPKTVNDLKVVLQAYPVSLPKKDQESIIKAVAEFVEE